MNYDARNMLVSSDYPLDKVISMAEGSFSAPAGMLTTEDVTHPFSFAPLPLGSWTNSGTWAVSYEYYSGPPSTSPMTEGPFPYDVRIESTTTKVTVTCFNYSGSPATIKYRIYCMMPSNVSELADFTVQESNDLVISTDFNYTKLFDADIYNQPATGGMFTVPISHSLGYRPQVISWVYLSGIMRPAMNMTEVTNSDIIFHFNNPGTLQMHYRIYIDE